MDIQEFEFTLSIIYWVIHLVSIQIFVTIYIYNRKIIF